MKKREPAFPWCTGVPRPTVIANLDAEEVLIFYYTAPVCASVCKIAVMKFSGARGIESSSINDEKNHFLRSGLVRDSIYVKTKGGKKEYVFLFHNEVIKITADSLVEIPGEDNLPANIIKHQNSEFERE
ncbi:hypothetical protein [uncultured Desulfobacter sp.]|uniref:hypothetical protein n=1 Tax=uncultured Desulfobacter sp. TaxID=240139 RepID=UPI002AAAB6D7|nr:hypothetical protein [uncultured Desulfobacter sp.]